MAREVVAIARTIAIIAHIGQTDKAGMPYIAHPRRVAEHLTKYGYPDYVVAAGWLHDVLEDTPVKPETLRAAGIDQRTVDIVLLLTRTPEVSPAEYYARIREDSDAQAVKRADISDNSDPERLSLLDEPTRLRLTKKYETAMAAIS